MNKIKHKTNENNLTPSGQSTETSNSRVKPNVNKLLEKIRQLESTIEEMKISSEEQIEHFNDEINIKDIRILQLEDAVSFSESKIKSLTKDIQSLKEENISNEQEYDINLLTKKVTEDLENLKLNTAIAAFMSFVKKIKERGFITKQELKIFLILLNPLAPHITSEIYEIVFNKNILEENWPSYDINKLNKEIHTVVVQVNGKIRGKIFVSSEATEEEIIELAKEVDNVKLFIENRKIIKTITIPNKIVNIVVK